MDDKKTYSISFRLQRTTTDVAFVSVPVTADLMQEQPERDGTMRIDVEKMVQRAVEIGAADTTKWKQEDQIISPHPIQMPPE